MKERDAEGKYTTKLTTQEVLDCFNGEPLTTKEITERLDQPKSTVYDKLRELHREGKLHRKKTGDRHNAPVVWFT